MRTSDLPGGHGTRPGPRRARRLAGVLAPVALLGLATAAMAAATGPGEPEHALDQATGEGMGAQDVPSDVFSPVRDGDGSVASFASFLATARALNHGRPAPRPDDLDALRAATAAAASGTVISAKLHPETVEVGELSAARIDLVIELGSVTTFDAPDDIDTSVWTRTVWLGDPVVLDGMLHRLRTELGLGPIGAETVVFGNITDTPEGPVLGVYDGLVDDGSAVARLSLVLATPSGELASVGSVIQQMGG